jgi:phage gpG-like protein
MIEPGMKIDDSELDIVLGKIIDRCANKTAALKIIGAIGRESIRTNFMVSGRPVKWKPSKRSADQGIPGRAGSTLRDSNRLMNSITSTVQGDSVIIGTNVEYAAVHNYGAKKFSFGTFASQVRSHERLSPSGKRSVVREHKRKVKLPWGDIPAREFVLLQDADIPEIEMVMAAHLTGESNV